MFITVNDIIVDLAYPIRERKVAVVIMLSDNIQYWLKDPMKILLKTGEEMELVKGVYTDKELNALIGLELKSKMDSRDYILKENKLENVTKMVISLDKIDNTYNLKDGKPSNTFLCTMCLAPNILRILNQRPLNIRNSKMVRLFL